MLRSLIGHSWSPFNLSEATSAVESFMTLPTSSLRDWKQPVSIFLHRNLLSTAREGNVFTRVCDSVPNRPHGYLVTAHPCWLLNRSLLCHCRYASHWDAFLFIYIFVNMIGENLKLLHGTHSRSLFSRH